MVTCYVTKEKIHKENSFKVVLEGHKRANYFKSEDVYNNWIKESLAESEFRASLNYIIDKSKYAKTNPIFEKKIKIWALDYSFHEMNFCLSIYRDEIRKYKAKGVPYISQIIENKLIENSNNYINRFNSRKVLDELDYMVDESINNYKYNKKKEDITKWL